MQFSFCSTADNARPIYADSLLDLKAKVDSWHLPGTLVYRILDESGGVVRHVDGSLVGYIGIEKGLSARA